VATTTHDDYDNDDDDEVSDNDERPRQQLLNETTTSQSALTLAVGASTVNAPFSVVFNERKLYVLDFLSHFDAAEQFVFIIVVIYRVNTFCPSVRDGRSYILQLIAKPSSAHAHKFHTARVITLLFRDEKVRGTKVRGQRSEAQGTRPHKASSRNEQ